MKHLAASLFLGLGLTSAPAWGYVRTTTENNVPVRWPHACVTVIAHTANPPPNLTPDLMLSAARAAAAAWSRGSLACSGFELQVTGSNTADTPTANDQVNNLVFRKADWEYDASALAITTVFAQQASGTVVDADVELNAAPIMISSALTKMFKWGDLIGGQGAEGGAEDLQNTLTHEFGHLLGLDHNCYLKTPMRIPVDDKGNPVPDCRSATPAMQDATMYPAVSRGDTLRRTLSDDDIAGVCAIYPAATSSCTDSGGGCAYGGPARSGGLALAMGVLLFSVLRRRARSRG
jgi:hypothetical protein